ncbi:hypothetical protein [Natronoglycomyces albus]|uniref:Uncharacterized protein n=1 Tax=Natronoglycomyces albus TaxID=2811108 RepID=A0A895XS53_9ACTN|nr:hypothetical protein [Natronoglycomyces albus]QSB06035.1 hypothetical protein JQS30_03680 [Natronoglycomyces albus]
MSSEYTLYTSVDSPDVLGERFADALECHAVFNDDPDTLSYAGEFFDLDILSNLSSSFDDQAELIDATPTAVVMTPHKGTAWASETRIVRLFIDAAIQLWKDFPLSTGIVTDLDERCLMRKHAGSGIAVDPLLLNPNEYNQTSEFDVLASFPPLSDSDR